MPKKKIAKKKIAKKKIVKKTVKKAAKRKVASKAANHGRAPGKTQISISVPTALIAKVDKLAAKENRNRSNFISSTLEELV